MVLASKILSESRLEWNMMYVGVPTVKWNQSKVSTKTNYMYLKNV